METKDQNDGRRSRDDAKLPRLYPASEPKVKRLTLAAVPTYELELLIQTYRDGGAVSHLTPLERSVAIRGLEEELHDRWTARESGFAFASEAERLRMQAECLQLNIHEHDDEIAQLESQLDLLSKDQSPTQKPNHK